MSIRFTPQEAIKAFQKDEAEAMPACRYIRSKMDLADQEFIFSKISDDNPIVREFLTGICFANSWQEIWYRPKSFTISSSQRSTDWFVLTVERYLDKIQLHVNIRNSLERAMLKGEWDEASQLITQHVNKLGPSFWSLNWTIVLLEEYSGAIKKNEYLDNLQNSESGELAHFFANFFSLSSDQNINDSAYRRVVSNWLPQKGGLRSLIELIYFEDLSANWSLPEILDRFEFIPLIDRYEQFIRLVAIAISEKHKDSPRLVKALKRIGSKCLDGCTQYIVEAADSSVQISSLNSTSELIAIWDAYALNEYENSLDLSNTLLSKAPHLLPAHELAVKSQLYLKQNELAAGTTPVSSLAQNLRNIYEKNDKSDDSLKYLEVFARRFKVFSLTQPLRALCANQSSNLPDERQYRRGSYTYMVHGPRNFEYGHPNSINHEYLNRCCAVYPKSISIRFFHSLASGMSPNEESSFENIPKVRRYFFAGLAAYRQGNLDQGLAYLKGFLRLQKDDGENPLSPFAIEEARRALVEIYRIKGDVVNMQTEVVNALIDRPQSVRRLSLSRIFESSHSQKQIASSHIEYPIIAHLACDNPHDIYIALRHFLYKNSLEKPSELIKATMVNLFNDSKLAVLLLRVCTPEVIDSLDALDSVAKVESERLTILRWVSKNVKSLQSGAETEILRLVQHIQLREALEKIDGARVVVNVAALREAERERYKDIIFRFLALREVAYTKADQKISEIINTISTMDIPEGKMLVINSDTLRSQRESTIVAFGNAFKEIRNSFVYSAHFGIEASLSSRIRHGIVIQHIRMPFVERQLAVQKDSAERPEIEKYWQSRMNYASKYEIDFVMKVLFELTVRINSIADEVKSEWLHSRTESKHPKGLFNFAFYTPELNQILEDKIHDVKDAETFLDRVFDIFLERTRNGLVEARKKIDEDLRQMLGSAVDHAISSVSESVSTAHLLPLKNDLTLCRQETERLCDQMMAWFQEADATLMGDAGLDLVLRTAIGMVEQLNPEVRGRFHTVHSNCQRIRGRYFTSLVHIVFFMLDNARGHSDVKKSEFEATVNLTIENQRLKITVISKMNSMEAGQLCKSQLLERIRQLEDAFDPEQVIREGGSGYAKIFAEIRYGFKQPFPIVEANCDKDGLLNVMLEFSIEGLSA